MHKDNLNELPNTLQPMARIADVQDVVDAIVYLAEADRATGEVLHGDGGAHIGSTSIVMAAQCRAA
jgi:hypothetical protein